MTRIRIVLQLADDLAREHGAQRVALTVAPPAPTGDLRLDAFIAGLTEHRLNQEHLPLPRWIADAARLDAPWTPAGVTPDHAVPELAARGVLVDHTDLTSMVEVVRRHSVMAATNTRRLPNMECIAYDTSMTFAEVLLAARTAAGLTQSELETLSGIARPNIAAFEAGRREPRWNTATHTLEATGATIDIGEPITWTWTSGRRPYAVPSRLWRLNLRDAFRRFTPHPGLWWSGPAPLFDLADRNDRARAYELVLREGQPDDIRSVIDGALLIDAWPDLVIPADLQSAWQPMIDEHRSELEEAR
jgi:transcriptional regulator with XRE-family HTH domain